MSEATLGEISAKLDGHAKLDEVQFLAVTMGIARIESAVMDHAKVSAQSQEGLESHMRQKIDALALLVVNLSVSQSEMKDALHTAVVTMIKGDADVGNHLNKRISSTKDWLMGGFVMASLPVIAWMVIQLWGTK